MSLDNSNIKNFFPIKIEKLDDIAYKKEKK